MAERSEYFILNQTNTIHTAFPDPGSSGDNVVVSVYDVDDANQDVSEAAMTHVVANTWKYAWSSPNQTNNYIIDMYNKTLEVHNYIYARLTGSITGAPTGATDGDTLTNLQKEFLLSIDNYNADDLTGDGSAGDQATRVINQALQKIYGMISDSTWMQSNPSTLASVADQEYIELSGISDIDHVTSIRDTTNDQTLVRIPLWKYRQMVPDPSANTGTPSAYTRLFNRLYLTPRPTSAITYQVDYRKNVSNLSSGSDKAAIPIKFNYWIIAEAHLFWQRMVDPADTATMNSLVALATDARTTALRDIYANFDEAHVSESRWYDMGDGFNAKFDSPVG